MVCGQMNSFYHTGSIPNPKINHGYCDVAWAGSLGWVDSNPESLHTQAICDGHDVGDILVDDSLIILL